MIDPSELPNAQSYILLTDENVGALYGEKILATLKNEGKKVKMITIPAGEGSKTRETKNWVEDEMFRLGVDRKTVLICLGGGVVGDLGGFVAATYMRGIRYVQIPTTLLSMVDSSLGGKTGVDTPYGKNLIGAYYLPEKTMFNLDFLETLPQHEFLNGMVEAVKIFMTSDAESLKFADENWDAIVSRKRDLLEKIVNRAAELKLDIVGRDLTENGERQVLNFGHTIGHALEKLHHYQKPHGFMVAWGIAIEAKLAEIQGHLSPEIATAVLNWIRRFSLDPLELDFEPEMVWNAMRNDKKNVNGEVFYVTLKNWGEVVDGWVKPMNFEEFKSALGWVRKTLS